ncbi:dickkopf-related protein 3-like isoform X1 [Eleutherodactylus coqui]|uniref:dickkopf-related protein 3-like isoform X1 n=1 Tax=Eleutherodactylus coqui TaxID=57060 RepID=UPI0034622227
MMQFRMITILLIVFLSLGFNVAHSELKPIHSPCINSTNCESGCCYRFHTKRAGICAPSCYTACFGPNVGERCFYSSECNSGCCHGEDLMTDARCKHKRSEDQKCFGPKDGDLCHRSRYCNSGCCRAKAFAITPSTCSPKAEENQYCDVVEIDGLHENCPCANGLLCVRDGSDLIIGICKKPHTANKCS